MARSYVVDVNVDDPTNAVWFQEVGNISDANKYFPNTIYGEASFDLTVRFWHGEAEAGNEANFQSGDDLVLYGRIEDQPCGVSATSLATGTFTIGQNEILFDVNAGVVPNEWSRVDTDTTAKYPIAIWFNGTHEGDEITGKTNVIVIDKNHVGTGDALILDASNLTYTPADAADWTVTPTLMNEGLDELADRVKTIEDNPSAGDMQASIYDPQDIGGTSPNADVFDRNNMTGTQLASTISDFDSAVSANANVSGTVTIHSDVFDAGSGVITGTTERTNWNTAFAHVSSTANPHNVDADDVGRTIAQWNASQIQGINAPTPAGASDDQKAMVYDFSSNTIVYATMPGSSGGEANDLVLDAGATGEDIRSSKIGSDIFVKGILGANNASVSTVGSDVVIDVVDAIEGTRGAIAIANAGDMASGIDDTKAVTPAKLETRLVDFLTKTGTSKSVSGAYTLLAGDEGTNLYIDDTLTIPVLTADYQVTVRNKSASAVSITLSGVTAENTTDTEIAGKGTITIYYEDTTKVWIDGNTEA